MEITNRKPFAADRAEFLSVFYSGYSIVVYGVHRIGQKFKVFDPVIITNTVLVVNNFFRKRFEGTVKMLFHYMAIAFNPFAIYGEHPVPMNVKTANAIRVFKSFVRATVFSPTGVMFRTPSSSVRRFITVFNRTLSSHFGSITQITRMSIIGRAPSPGII